MKSLIINPGSQSTKIAVYEDTEVLWSESIEHTMEELAPFKEIYDQLDFRKELIEDAIEAHGTSWEDIDIIMSRGGLLPPVKSGAYEINELMVEVLRDRPQNVHASNLASGIALQFKKAHGIPAYIYDPVTVDELLPIAKITGLPDIKRKGMGHNLNMRACAIQFAEDQGKPYDSLNIIVAHMGGGITSSLHEHGRITDMISDDDGTFSPERVGGLPVFQVVEKMDKENLNQKQFMKILQREGGLMAYFGTKDARDVEAMIAEGNKKADLVYRAMALNIGRNIARLSVMVNGDVDAILLTGGMAYSELLTGLVRERVEFIAPFYVYPGEHEMEALAKGAWRLYNGKEKARTFQ